MPSKSIQQLLEKYNFTPTKIRGQNFLIDEEMLDKIVSAGKIAKQDIVVEIGPGFGFLTRKLAAKAKKVLALEIDSRMVAPLKEELQTADNTEVIVGDALDFNFKKYEIEPAQYLLIANIPYQITGKIFEKFLLGDCPPKRAVLLMQREVGERILANDDEQNFLSVVLKTAYNIRRVANVSREKFYPAPKVDSVVLSFSRTASLAVGFAHFVHQGFGHPKKKLMNNLTTLISKEQLVKIFNLLGIDLDVRPGKIDLPKWSEFFAKLKIKQK